MNVIKNNHHWCKPIILKNWKTGKFIKCKSQNEFSRKYNIPFQVVSDIKNKRRKYYGSFCLPDYPVNKILKYSFKNLRTGKIYRFQVLKNAEKILKIPSKHIIKLSSKSNYRYKHFGNLDFNNYNLIPQVINKVNGSKTFIFDKNKYCKSNDIKYKQLYYLLKVKRIPSNSDLELKGFKNYKYKIKNKITGKIFTCLTLKDFAIKNNIKPIELYVRNKKCKFEVIEG